MTSSSWGSYTRARATILARSISSTAPERQANHSECNRSLDTSLSAKRARMRRWATSRWLGRARVKRSTVKQKLARVPMIAEAQLYLAELAQRQGDGEGAQAALAVARATSKRIDRGTTVARIILALGAARVSDIARHPAKVLDELSTVAGDSLMLTAEERAEIEALRARAYGRLGRLDLAVATGRRAVAAVERIRTNMNPGVLRTSYTAERVQTYADLVVALLKLGRGDEAFQVSDVSRGRGLADQLGLVARSLDEGRLSRRCRRRRQPAATRRCIRAPTPDN